MRTQISMSEVKEIVHQHILAVRKTKDFYIPLVIRKATPSQFKKALEIYSDELLRIRKLYEEQICH